MKHLKHLLSIGLLTREEVIYLIYQSLVMTLYYCRQQVPPLPTSLRRKLLKPKLVTLFQEKSTRTKDSFEEAAERILLRRGSAITSEESSLGKGESLMHTLRMLIQQGADVVVLRSAIEGAGLHLAQCLERTGGPESWVRQDVSIIVGGAGTRDHPSQIILDLVTIVLRRLGIKRMDEADKLAKILKRMRADELKILIGKIIDELKISFVGDLFHSRVVNDWIHLSRLFHIHFIFIAPEIVQVEKWLRPHLSSPSDNLNQAKKTDIVYTIRMQIERLSKTMPEHEARQIVRSLQIDEKFMEGFSGLVMDALPIDVNSPTILPSLYNHPQVIMFEQSGCGIPTRMAILVECLLGRKQAVRKLEAPAVKPKVLLIETSKKHTERMKEKSQDQQRSVNPIYNGTVFDRINKGMISYFDLVLARAGVYKTGHGPIILARECDSTDMGQKEIFFLENRFVPYPISAALKFVSPSNRVIEIKEDQGMYYKLEFPLPKAVSDVFVCPNDDCITNHDPEAQTFFNIEEERAEGPVAICVYCEHQFSRSEIIEHLPRKRW